MKVRGKTRKEIIKALDETQINVDRWPRTLIEFETRHPNLTFIPDVNFDMPGQKEIKTVVKKTFSDTMVIQAIRARKDSARINDLRRALSGELPWAELEERMMEWLKENQDQALISVCNVALLFSIKNKDYSIFEEALGDDLKTVRPPF